jgi:hypothetical protein
MANIIFLAVDFSLLRSKTLQIVGQAACVRFRGGCA